MCHAHVTRTPKKGEEKLEFLKPDGDWTVDAKEASRVSEEDAKVFVRTLEKHTRGKLADYTFDYKIIDD